MKWSQRALTVTCLAFGLLATGILSLAVVTDYWLFTSEPFYKVLEYNETTGRAEGLDDRSSYDSIGNSTSPRPDVIKIEIRAHSGLWRVCIYYEGMKAPSCSVINYIYQDWDRVQEADTTWSIRRAIRKSSPVIVLSLLLMIFAFTVATVGNTKKDFKTISGAVLYIFAALILAVGAILYMSAVNDEVSNRKDAKNPDGSVFAYRYGWAFFCTSVSFSCAMLASVANITLYLNRYPTVDDMAIIIPGLAGNANYDIHKLSKDDDLDTSLCPQNPTVVV